MIKSSVPSTYYESLKIAVNPLIYSIDPSKYTPNQNVRSKTFSSDTGESAVLHPLLGFMIPGKFAWNRGRIGEKKKCGLIFSSKQREIIVTLKISGLTPMKETSIESYTYIHRGVEYRECIVIYQSKPYILRQLVKSPLSWWNLYDSKNKLRIILRGEKISY